MTGSAVPAVDAATVILVRESPDSNVPWELFMVRRPMLTDFAADMYVFPGGKVDPADRDPAVAGAFDTTLPGDISDAPAFRAAAIRELFEEAGVLLATSAQEGVEATDHRQVDLRRQLRAAEIDLKDMVVGENLALQASALHPFAHWITPESMPRRYNTWFYLARLPDDRTAQHDEVETVDSVWISPREALHRARAGNFPLVFVTEKVLERMAPYESIDALLGSTSAADLRPIMPKVMNGAEGEMFLLPGDAGY